LRINRKGLLFLVFRHGSPGGLGAHISDPVSEHSGGQLLDVRQSVLDPIQRSSMSGTESDEFGQRSHEGRFTVFFAIRDGRQYLRQHRPVVCEDLAKLGQSGGKGLDCARQFLNCVGVFVTQFRTLSRRRFSAPC
jgi:hypothetical protein